MQKFFIAVAVACSAFVAWILYMANTNQATFFFDLVRNTRNGDKYGHVLLFGVLTLILILASGFRRVGFARLSFYIASLLMLAFVTAEEISQVFFPDRTVDIYDYGASVLGVLVFSLLGWCIQTLGCCKR